MRAVTRSKAASELRTFRRLALAACVATYLLIFIGGLVRVSGAGLGCPDWPRCFGRWLPPTDVTQLPPNIDSSLFNLTLAWIEYANRLVGAMVGLIILAAALWALWRLRSRPSLVWPASLAAILVAIEGWLGSVVVSSLLEPWIVTAHLVLALIIASLLLFVTLDAYRHERPPATAARYPPRVRLWLSVLWLLALVQIVLGTQIRGALEHLIERFPLLGDAELLARVGQVSHFHLGLGLAVGLFTWIVGLRLLRLSHAPSPLVVAAAGAAMALVTLQLLIGLGFVLAGIPAIVQLLHSWVASLYLGTLLVLFAGARQVATT